ncbi:MAG TPA: hypothetical protein VN282_05665 [Pyrinomonadaceae bacterium]|nr:hypothetical protein [Pyrinomonadaceae bacterium]
MGNMQDGMLPVIKRNYAVLYKNEYDQVEALEGVLVHLDLNGFTILNVDARRVIIPKDRIFVLRESASQTTENDVADKPPNADDKLGESKAESGGSGGQAQQS